MKKISFSFNQAAGGKTDTGFSIFWMTVLAIAILDDSDQRERDRKKKRGNAHVPRR